MKQVGRFAAVLLATGAIFVLIAVPVFAQEDDEGVTPEPISEQTEEGSSGLEPAVPIPQEAEAEVIPDWTYRYLVPAGLVLAVVVILMTSIQYFTNVVRKRYRIVEE
jgi:hypothetical protein